MLCLACGDRMCAWISMPLDAKKDEATAFGDIVRCARCGLGRTAQMPAGADVARFYDLESYYTHGESHMRPIQPKLIDRILVRLAWQADRATPFDVDELASALPPHATVLDLGCGDGEKLQAFQERGFAVLGVDPDPRSRALVASKGLAVLPGTAEEPPAELAGRRFDLVIMSHSLEHCLDPARALETVRTLIAPDGLAYIEVPNAGCHHFETLRECSEMFDAPRHLWFFTREALQRLAQTHGLQIARWHYNGFTRLFTPSWRGWECEIFDRLARRGLARGARRHTLPRSAFLLIRSAFAPPHRKYDSIGLVAAPAPSTGDGPRVAVA